MADKGTVVITEETVGADNKITFSWTSGTGVDEGCATKTTTNAYTGEIIRLVTVPGTAPDAPADNYDVTITDEDDTDVLMGVGANRDVALSEQVLASLLGVVVNDKLSLSITNAGDSKTGTVYLYIGDNSNASLSSHALTTLTTVKEYLSIALTDTTQDSFLTRLINAISDSIEGECRRHFELATYTAEEYKGNGRRLLMLNQYPVLSVASVTVDDVALVVTDYELKPELGAIYNEDEWDKYSDIKVTYTAGYVLPKDVTLGPPAVVRTLPYDMEDACIAWVAIKYEMRGSEHLKTEVVGPLRSDFIQEEIPIHVKRLINRYKKALT